MTQGPQPLFGDLGAVVVADNFWNAQNSVDIVHVFVIVL